MEYASSQLIRYSRACGSYHEFLDDRGLQLTKKQLCQVFLVVKLRSSLLKFYGLFQDFVNRYGISVSHITSDMFPLSHITSDMFPLSLSSPLIIRDLSLDL